jgi:hypothetical protein
MSSTYTRLELPQGLGRQLQVEGISRDALINTGLLIGRLLLALRRSTKFQTLDSLDVAAVEEAAEFFESEAQRLRKLVTLGREGVSPTNLAAAGIGSGVVPPNGEGTDPEHALAVLDRIVHLLQEFRTTEDPKLANDLYEVFELLSRSLRAAGALSGETPSPVSSEI